MRKRDGDPGGGGHSQRGAWRPSGAEGRGPHGQSVPTLHSYGSCYSYVNSSTVVRLVQVRKAVGNQFSPVPSASSRTRAGQLGTGGRRGGSQPGPPPRWGGPGIRAVLCVVEPTAAACATARSLRAAQGTGAPSCPRCRLVCRRSRRNHRRLRPGPRWPSLRASARPSSLPWVPVSARASGSGVGSGVASGVRLGRCLRCRLRRQARALPPASAQALPPASAQALPPA